MRIFCSLKYYLYIWYMEWKRFDEEMPPSGENFLVWDDDDNGVEVVWYDSDDNTYNIGAFAVSLDKFEFWMTYPSSPYEL